MYSFLEILSDCIFPPGEDALRVRTLTEETLEDLLFFDLYKGVHTMYAYKNPLIKSAIWQLKYRDDTRIARLFGTALHKTLLHEIITPHLVIPIPLAPQRFRERGYNQVERFVFPATRDHAHATLATDILYRNKSTSSQTRLGKQERLKNLAHVFTVPDPTRVHGKNTILIDDVVTTGSTLHHARDTLLRAGAKSVTMIALAH